LPGAGGRDQGGDGDVVDGAELAAGGLVDLGDGVVGEQVGGAADCFEVVADVPGGLVAGHALHLVADGDPLVEGGQDAELDVVPQGGLGDQDGRERVLESISWLVSYLELQITDLMPGLRLCRRPPGKP